MHSFLSLVLAEYHQWAITSKALVRRQAGSQPHDEIAHDFRELPAICPEIRQDGAKIGLREQYSQPHTRLPQKVGNSALDDISCIEGVLYFASFC
jgi:hypothetical protein